MKYKNYQLDDFIQDEYFQKWVLQSDAMTDNFWSNWLSLNPDKKDLVNEAKQMVRLLASDEEKLAKEDFDTMWQHIVDQRAKSTKRSPGTSSGNTTIRVMMRVAAVFIGIMGLSLGIYFYGSLGPKQNLPMETRPQITLELQDGSIKVIDEGQSGVITTSEGGRVVNQQYNKLVYDNTENEGEQTLVYNQLIVPYGRKFEVVLSDGSHIFLNSGSKLRYPVTFLKDKARDVFLDGEAYFSVSKDEQRPFTVVTDDMNTQVYGTEFNVSSYKNESNTFTVLVEGSVGVYHSNNVEGTKPITIVPGQRAVYENGAIDVETANIDKYIGWKQGKLVFVDDRFELILKELERNFDVQFENQYEDLNDMEFTGTFAYGEPLEKILRICKEHTPFNFTRNGNTITITNN
ncbi:DUF4974 domain-containing protein [Flagellimonas marinaquae]|nr:DUF4974 domain-containing protein [Allomuricauda aquimarina]